MTPAVSCVYADEHLLVLYKPAGLLSVPGRGADKQDCLSQRALLDFPDALVVHRLDMATSGLVLMARSLAMQRALGLMFERRQIGKRYLAVVDGQLALPPDTSPGGWGLIDLPIAADWPRRPLQMIDTVAGKPSQTCWQPLAQQAQQPANDPHTTRLLLEPLTGRTHQLRLHLQAIGHPILGDMLYAPAAVQVRASRLLLQATQLRLVHPATGSALCIDCPADF